MKLSEGTGKFSDTSESSFTAAVMDNRGTLTDWTVILCSGLEGWMVFWLGDKIVKNQSLLVLFTQFAMKTICEIFLFTMHTHN